MNAVNEAAPNSYPRSSRPVGGGLHHLTATEFLDPIEVVLDFGFRALVRLRIISVPCGGPSWRRDRLPEDDGEPTAKAPGIESRAVRGDVGSPRRRS